MIDLLACHALPQDGGAVIRYHLWWATFDRDFKLSTGRSLYTLQHLFELGIRWDESSKEEIAGVRSWLLKASNYTFVDAMKLLATRDYCAPEVLHELGRTPAMRRRMKEVGFVPPTEEEASQFQRPRQPSRLTRSREVLKKFGVAAVKPKRSPASRSRASKQGYRGFPTPWRSDDGVPTEGSSGLIARRCSSASGRSLFNACCEMGSIGSRPGEGLPSHEDPGAPARSLGEGSGGEENASAAASRAAIRGSRGDHHLAIM